MRVKEPTISNGVAYHTFITDCDNEREIMLIYNVESKEIDYINSTTKRSRIYRSPGKYFKTFEEFRNSVKSAKTKGLIDQVENYYNTHINAIKEPKIVSTKEIIEDAENEYFKNPILINVMQQKEILS